MTLSIIPYTPEFNDAAVAFNDRMRAGKAPTAFVLPTRGRPVITHGAVTTTQYLAVDETGAARGGMLCQEYPAWVSGRRERIMNISAPLSEGIIDAAYTFTGPTLIKVALKQNPFAFVVGMGSAGNPLPRLLKAMGWRVMEAPFLFRLLRPARAVRQLAPLRTSAVRRLAAAVAGTTGVATVGAALLHRSSPAARRAASALQVEPVSRWTDEVSRVWETFAPAISLGVERTPEVLRFFYPEDGSGARAWVLRRGGAAAGWFGLLVTKMRNNQYFGDLTVATLTDCVGDDEACAAAPLLAAQQARVAGADIILTNQQHRSIAESCAAAGWRRGPSNFLIAASKALSADVDWDRAYITRRDGDGLVNLSRGGP